MNQAGPETRSVPSQDLADQHRQCKGRGGLAAIGLAAAWTALALALAAPAQARGMRPGGGAPARAHTTRAAAARGRVLSAPGHGAAGGSAWRLALARLRRRPGFLLRRFSPVAGRGQKVRQRSKAHPAPHASPGHIFLVIPAFNVSYRRRVPPLTPHQKFVMWARGAYDPLGLGADAVKAALEHSPHGGFCDYGSGLPGYGKCFGSALLDANVSSFFGDYLFPVWLHQDPRYFRLGHGSIPLRIAYSISRVFITRTDSGGNAFATASLMGTVLAGVTSNLYYPRRDRGVGLTLSRMEWDLAGTAIFNLEAEFWPDIEHAAKRVL